MNDIDAALEFTDKTCRSGSLAGILAAEVRRLRDDAASTAGKIIKMTIEHDWAIGEAKRLQAENERLRKDAERYQWLRDAGATFYTGGPEITDGSDKMHVCEFAMDDAIDAARGEK